MSDEAFFTLRDGSELHIGDDVDVVLTDGSVYGGHLDTIDAQYIILANTGHAPMEGWGTSLAFPVADIRDIRPAGN